VGAKEGQTKKSAGRQRALGRQRLALVVFGGLFVLLFLGFVIAQGIGEPDVPAGDVAIVEGVPDDVGSVSEAEFRRALVQQAAQGGLKKPPKPGEKKYEELKEAALSELLDTIWIQGEAEELGISVTPKQIATELSQIKEQNFKSEAEYQKFLKTSRFTKEDVLARVKLQLLSTQIQESITNAAPPPSSDEVEEFYDAQVDTQFTTPESRDVRMIVNSDKGKVEQAKAMLEKDDSPAGWKEAASKYSSDPTTKSKGGLQTGLSAESLQEPLRAAAFDGPAGVLVGPLSYQGNNYVLQVEKLNPAKVQSLKEVSAQIKSQLAQQLQQEFFSEFVANYQSKWQSRTFCAEGYVIERCANYVGDGRPPSAPPACYEADPKGPAPKDCPAPVQQVAPALPGSVTSGEPQGKRLPQRPRPEGLEETGEEAGLSLPAGVPPVTE
jgi:parvulin-like peptidyl-prolyl isomerase